MVIYLGISAIFFKKIVISFAVIISTVLGYPHPYGAPVLLCIVIITGIFWDFQQSGIIKQSPEHLKRSTCVSVVQGHEESSNSSEAEVIYVKIGEVGVKGAHLPFSTYRRN